MEINASEYDKLWMLTVYDMAQRNERPTYRKVRLALLNKLPREYDPRRINKRLAQYKGMELTLHGIDLIAPKADIFVKSNMVIKAIQRQVRENPETSQLETKDIAASAGLPESDAGYILKLVQQYGSLWSGGSVARDYDGYSSIRLDNSDDRVFDQLLYFESIEKIIDDLWRRQEEYQQNDTLTIPKINGHSEDQDNSFLRVKPIFTSRAQKNATICFVIMPFTQGWSSSVFQRIKTLVESMNYQCLRADNQPGRIIMEDIWTGILQAAFIIADVTGPNANVMYELGIADTVGTPVILLTQDIKSIPFDLRHYRHIEYKNEMDGWNKAEEQIGNIISKLSNE